MREIPIYGDLSLKNRIFASQTGIRIMKRKLDIGKKRLIGYAAGILAGVSYGTNPLFGKALMESGVPILVMLFFRYGIAAAILAVWMLLRKETFRAGRREIGLLVLLGLFFAGSSLTLFFSYDFIPSGLATTLVYLYPVFVALIMVFLRIYPSWQTWLSILATFGGILLLSAPSGNAQIRLPGILLAVGSALCYSFYLVVVNRSKRIRNTSEHTITLYSLVTGALLFALIRTTQGGGMLEGIDDDFPAHAGDFVPLHRPDQDRRPGRVRTLDGHPHRHPAVRRALDLPDGHRHRHLRGRRHLHDPEARQSGRKDAFPGMSAFVDMRENDYFWER